MGARHSNASHIDPQSVDLALLSVISTLSATLGTLGQSADALLLDAIRTMADRVGRARHLIAGDDVVDLVAVDMFGAISPFLKEAFDARALAYSIGDTVQMHTGRPVDTASLANHISHFYRKG